MNNEHGTQGEIGENVMVNLEDWTRTVQVLIQFTVLKSPNRLNMVVFLFYAIPLFDCRSLLIASCWLQ